MLLQVILLLSLLVLTPPVASSQYLVEGKPGRSFRVYDVLQDSTIVVETKTKGSIRAYSSTSICRRTNVGVNPNGYDYHIYDLIGYNGEVIVDGLEGIDVFMDRDCPYLFLFNGRFEGHNYLYESIQIYDASTGAYVGKIVLDVALLTPSMTDDKLIDWNTNSNRLRFHAYNSAISQYRVYVLNPDDLSHIASYANVGYLVSDDEEYSVNGSITKYIYSKSGQDIPFNPRALLKSDFSPNRFTRWLGNRHILLIMGKLFDVQRREFIDIDLGSPRAVIADYDHATDCIVYFIWLDPIPKRSIKVDELLQ
jgi:hypothetical protein